MLAQFGPGAVGVFGDEQLRRLSGAMQNGTVPFSAHSSS